MSSRNILYFDEMNILEYEKTARTTACDALSGMIYKEFQNIEDGEKSYNTLKKRLLLAFTVWAVDIGFIGEKQLRENKNSIEETLGIQIATILPKLQPVLDVSDSKEETINKMGHIVDNIYRIVDTTKKNKEKPHATSRARADDIARTETNIAFNRMEHDAEKKKAKYHVWCSEMDKRVRDSHKGCDGQKKPINEPFDVNGYLMMYPMDDTFGAPIEEIAGCRCVEKFLY